MSGADARHDAAGMIESTGTGPIPQLDGCASALLEVVPEALFSILADADEKTFHWSWENPRATAILSRVAPDADRACDVVLSALQPHARTVLREGRPVVFDILRGDDGLSVEVELAPVPGPTGCTSILGVIRDITERREALRQLDHHMHHDELTGLPNRLGLTERLVGGATPGERGGSVAVVFVDVDRFKLVNDSLGHDAGDELLVTAARRMERVLRAGDVLCRLGDDEFAVVARGLPGIEEAVGLARRLRGVFVRPFVIGDGEVYLTASAGVAMWEGPGDCPERILRDAHAATTTAKALGRDRTEVFDETMRERATKRLDTERELRGALRRKEFCVYYQPLVRFSGTEVVGFEALLRWQHPERGLVGPRDFIPIAEETGLIVDIGAWVLHEVCREAASWAAAAPGAPPLQVSVNLSARQLAHPDLVATVAEALALSRLDPSTLSLEITESVLMDDPQLAVTILHALRSLGVHLSVDDFGTGHSSLGYLKALPVDCIKIDRTFVSGLGTDADDTAIVAAVVGLGHALGLSVTAEGVETPQQLGQLQALGCDVGQGFYFAKPQPGAVVGPLARRRLRWREAQPA